MSTETTVEVPEEVVVEKQGGSSVLKFLYGALVLMGVALAWVFNYTSTQLSYDQEYQQIASDQRLMGNEISKLALEAVNGNAQSFNRLAETKAMFEANLAKLQSGNAETGMPATPAAAQNALNDTVSQWALYGSNAQFILDRKDSILNLKPQFEKVDAALPKLEEISSNVAKAVAAEKGVPNSVVTATEALKLQFFRISTSIREILKGAQASAIAADTYYRDLLGATETMNMLLSGSGAYKGVSSSALKKDIGQMREMFLSMSQDVAIVLEGSSKVFESINAASDMSASDVAFAASTKNLVDAYLNLKNTRMISDTLAYVLAAALFGLVGLVYYFVQQDQKARFAETEEQRKLAEERRNAAVEKSAEDERAISRVMLSTQQMAMGKLNMVPETTADVMGGISDALSMMSENISEKLRTVQNFNDQVITASTHTTRVSERMAEEGEILSNKISAAEEKIKELIASFSETSNTTKNLLDESKESAQAVHEGAQALKAVLQLQQEIRQSIQDTAKRVKRLGENSQQISQVVTVIGDISDRIDLLAVNAELEASRASDLQVGRGFQVVAESVRSLSQNAKSQTAQIATLVGTIQADTAEAIASMEKSTEGVVKGSKMTESSANSFMKIEEYSSQIEALVETITSEVESNTASAKEVGSVMKSIREATAESASTTTETAQSIAKLASAAAEMRAELQEFELLEEDA